MNNHEDTEVRSPIDLRMEALATSLDVREENLKPRINEALYPLCPSAMTLGEFEVLTVSGQGWTHLLASYRASLEQAAAADERRANPPEPFELERTSEQIAANEAIIAKLVPKFLRGAQ